MKLDIIVIQLSHVERYSDHRQLSFDVHYAILDLFLILATENQTQAMLPGSLDFVMLPMHSNGFIFVVCFVDVVFFVQLIIFAK